MWWYSEILIGFLFKLSSALAQIIMNYRFFRVVWPFPDVMSSLLSVSTVLRVEFGRQDERSSPCKNTREQKLDTWLRRAVKAKQRAGGIITFAGAVFGAISEKIQFLEWFLSHSCVWSHGLLKVACSSTGPQTAPSSLYASPLHHYTRSSHSRQPVCLLALTPHPPHGGRCGRENSSVSASPQDHLIKHNFISSSYSL